MGDFQTYGMKDGKLIHISKVQSGLSCGCVCPRCQSTLIARKGQKNKHSFAHYCKAQSCGGGQESALHLMAKSIIAKEKKVYIPPEGKTTPGYIKIFDSVALEVRDYEGIIPDIILRDEAEIINVEIRVKHAVDTEKQSKLRVADLRTIEIDLHDLIDDFSEETVAEAIWSEERSAWVYSPIVDKEERAQNARAALCDLLPCEAQNQYWGEKVYCPLQKKSIWSLSSGGCHHACNYLDGDLYRKQEEANNNQVESIPCWYREKNIRSCEIDDVKNLDLQNGRIISADVLYHDVWEHWGGYSSGLLVRDFKPKNPIKPGSTVLELWKPNYQWMAIENIESGAGMLIPGKNGCLFRDGNDPNGRILGHYAQGGDFRCYHQKLYVVWDAEKPIWSLLRAKEMETKDNMLSANSAAHTVSNSSAKKNMGSSGRGHANLQQHEGSPSPQEKKPPYDLGQSSMLQFVSTTSEQPKCQQTSASRFVLQKAENVRPQELVFARCTICNRVDNARRFASFDGEGILKTGICNECYKRNNQ